MTTINLDNITLDDIINGLKTQQEKFDANKIDKFYHKSYPTELSKYVLVNPYDVYNIVPLGSVIRYIKKDADDISCVCIVKKIVESDEKSKNSGYLLLSLVSKEKMWKIYPANHYIFIYDRYLSNRSFVHKLEEKYVDQKKKYKKIIMPDKELHKVLKHMGMNEQQIQSDKNADKILAKRKHAPEYIKQKVTIDNVDNIVDQILLHNKKMPIKK